MSAPAAVTPGSGLAAALVEFQRALPAVREAETAHVTSAKGSYRYDFAPLATVVGEVLPRLAAVGLAYTARPEVLDGGRLVLRAELLHVDGERLSATWPLPGDADAQRLGIAVSFARRYCLLALCGVAPGGDDAGPLHAPPATRPATRRDDPSREAAAAGSGDRTDDQQRQMRRLFALLRDSPVDDRKAWASGLLGREVTSYGQLTGGEVERLIAALAGDRPHRAGRTATVQPIL
ncbi:MAG: ERF family protein [Pseudonocardia sp.]|nr:ERF family protein [Pseudonocardia sp.]